MVLLDHTLGLHLLEGVWRVSKSLGHTFHSKKLYGCCSPPSNLSCKQMLSRSCRGSHSIFCQSLDRLEHSLHCGQDGCLVHPLPSLCSPKVLYQTRPSPHGFLSLSDLPARGGLHPVLLRTDAPLQSGWRPSGPFPSHIHPLHPPRFSSQKSACNNSH